MENQITIIPEKALQIEQGRPWASSRIIAEIFQRRHKAILRSIRKLSQEVCANRSEQNCADLFCKTVYFDNSNRPQIEYLLSRDGFVLLAMGFTGSEALKFKLAYIQRFNELEALEVKKRGYLNNPYQVDYFTVAGFAAFCGFRIPLPIAARFGKRAKRLCDQRGISLNFVPDSRYGRVWLYPKKVLEEVFKEPIF